MILRKYFRFLAVGLPAFALAVPLNYLLVEFVHLENQLAYAVVLCMQVALNFVMCRLFVFDRKNEGPLLPQFLKFFGGIIFIRLFDWFLYAFLVNLGFYYILVQITNVLLFSVSKFLFARVLFEGAEGPTREQ